VPDQVKFGRFAVLLLESLEGHSNTLWLVVTPVPLSLLALEVFFTPATQLFRPGIPQDGEHSSQFRIQSSSCGGWFVWYFMVVW
jgi:hypothetical protein